MVDKELADKALEAIEIAKSTGKIKKGANEATKALERGNAKLVAIAKDVTPPEITMHMPILANEKGIPCIEIESKEELGAAAGIKVGTSAIAIVVEGDSKKVLAEINKKMAPAAKPEEKKEEAPKEEKKEAPKEEKKEEKPKKEKAEKKEEAKPEEKKEEAPKEEKKEESSKEEKPAEEKGE